MNESDPIRACQHRAAVMVAGTFEGIRAEEMKHGLAEARRSAETTGGHRVGCGLVTAMPRSERDDLRVWVAISDGQRIGAVMVSLNQRAATAGLEAGEDPSGHILDRLRATNDRSAQDRFDELARAHPLRF